MVSENEFEKQVERNLKGIKLEKKGETDLAVQLYEENIKENFEGSHPYDRLAIIYRKRRMILDEIRILKKAIWVFENIVFEGRSDRNIKLEKFKERLKQTKMIKKRL